MTKTEENILYNKIKTIIKQQEFYDKTLCNFEIVEDYNKSELLDDYGKEYLKKSLKELNENEDFKKYKIIKYYIFKRKDTTTIIIIFDITDKKVMMAEIAFGESDGKSDYYVINYYEVYKECWEEKNDSILIYGIDMNDKVNVKYIYMMDKVDIYDFTLNLLKMTNQEHERNKIDLSKVKFNASYFEIEDYEKEPNIYHIPVSDDYLNTLNEELISIFRNFNSEEEIKEFWFKKALEEIEKKTDRKLTEEEINMLKMSNRYIDKDEKIIIN